MRSQVDPLLKKSAFGCVLVLGRWERKKIKNLQKNIENKYKYSCLLQHIVANSK